MKWDSGDSGCLSDLDFIDALPSVRMDGGSVSSTEALASI